MTCFILICRFSFDAAAQPKGCACCRSPHKYIMATKFH